MKRFQSWLTDAIFLAFVSVSGYGLAFVFELGFAWHSGFPTYVIAPTPSNIAAAVLVIATLGLGLPMFGMFLLERRDLHERVHSVIVLMYFVFILLGMAVAPDGWPTYIFAAFGIWVMATFWVGEQRSKKRRLLSGPIFSWSPLVRHQFSLLLTIAPITLASLTLYAGAATGRSQQTFYFLALKPDFAVIRMYGEVVVAARINRATSLFTGEYIIGKFDSDDMKLSLKRERLAGRRPLRAFEAE